MKSWNLQVEFDLRDLWIGALWERDGNCLDVWVCLLPCVPIHFSCWGARWGLPSLDPDDQNCPVEPSVTGTTPINNEDQADG